VGAWPLSKASWEEEGVPRPRYLGVVNNPWRVLRTYTWKEGPEEVAVPATPRRQDGLIIH
jgi:hypothetical protein